MAGDEPGNAESWQSFGKRRSAEAEPAFDPSKPPVKRSKTVSLVLLAGAGVAAIGIGEFDKTQREEDVLVYKDAAACIAELIRSEADCRSDYAKALAGYPNRAPRYPSVSDCERHHGAGHCLPGESVAESARGRFVPRMAAFFLSRNPEQAADPEALFEHQPEETSSGHSGSGYCRCYGNRIVTSSGGRSSIARVASSSLHRTSFGGFGSTGRSFSSSARGFFGGG